jgi:hypothetical protein
MGIIKRVGEMVTGMGERVDRAGASMMSGVGYRSRTHALRTRIDSLPIPRIGGRRKGSNYSPAPASREARTRPVAAEEPPASIPSTYNGEITFKET